MRHKMPTLPASADALHQRMQQAKDLQKRQRLHARARVGSGRAHHRPASADLRGVHRPRGATRCAAYAAGGLAPLRPSQGPRPS
jgi:hypothetical protein